MELELLWKLAHQLDKETFFEVHGLLEETTEIKEDDNLIDLLERKRALNFETLEEFATKLLTECDYLILDDLGKETCTGNYIKPVNEWTYRFLFNILDSRNRTIINTNFSRAELLKIYDNAFVDRLTKGMRGDKDRIFKFSEGAESKR